MQVSNLKSYLAETGMTIKELGDKINYNTEYLRQIARGKAFPSFRLSRDIFNVTGGVVKLKTKAEKDNECKCCHNDSNNEGNKSG